MLVVGCVACFVTIVVRVLHECYMLHVNVTLVLDKTIRSRHYMNVQGIGKIGRPEGKEAAYVTHP